MTGLEPVALVLLLGWSVVVGLDLASVPQCLCSRPLVAGSVAGGLLGDPAAGFAVGAVLELYALDVLPIGATRYPDLGVATIAGVSAAAGSPGLSALGPAVGVALAMAMVSGPAIDRVRRANATRARAAALALGRGDITAVTRVHGAGIAHDAARALALGGIGLAVAIGIRSLGPVPSSLQVPLLLVAVAGGAGAATRGALRTATQGGRLAWIGIGLAAGLGLVLWA